MGSYSIRHAGEASIQGSERSGYRFPWYDGCFMPIGRPDCTCTCIFSGGHEAHETEKLIIRHFVRFVGKIYSLSMDAMRRQIVEGFGVVRQNFFFHSRV